MIPVLPAQLDWPSAIGNFILNYGVLEWHVLVFLETRLTADEFARIKGGHFQDRIACVKSQVAAGPYPAAQRQAFEKFFARLGPVRKLRNHIAHGLLLSRWQEDAKTWKILLAMPKDLDALDAPATRLLEFGELTQALTELPELIEEFKTLTGPWCEE